jgi:hypothetical protein
MKLFRPLQGPILFSCPAINVLRHEWRSRPSRTRLAFNVTIATCGAFFFTAWLASIAKIGVLAFESKEWPFTLLAFGILFFIGTGALRIPFDIFPTGQRQHSFYAQSALVYTGRGKSAYIRLHPDLILCIGWKDMTFEDRNFHLFTVKFKDTIPGLLPNLCEAKFGIPAEADLAQFHDWMEKHGVKVTHELEARQALLLSKKSL